MNQRRRVTPGRALLWAALTFSGAAGCGDDGAGGASSSTSSGFATANASTSVTIASSNATVASTTAKSVTSTGTVTACPTGPSDEFDDDCTLPEWELGPETQADVFDIDASTPGMLTVVPTQGVWNDNAKAWLLFKQMTGDFVIVAQIAAASVDDGAGPPMSPFNSAGLMARRPMLSSDDRESWVMYDLGRQQNFVGTEAKTTLDGESNLYLASGAASGRLSLCRVGETIYLARNLENEGAVWTRTHTFARPDLPVTLQVGIVANAYNSPDLRATFDYVRFGVPQTEADCTAELPPGG